MMMERIVSGKSQCSSRRRKSKISTSKKEEKLLRQLRQISLLMQESRLEGASPEMEAEEVPYGADWEGYPEETYPEYDSDHCSRRRFEKLRPQEPPTQPTAEALAERMEQEEEEIMARKLSIVQEEDEEEDEDRGEGDLNDDEDLHEGEEEEDFVEVEESMKEDDEEEEEEDEEEKQLLSPASPAVERKQERLGLEVSRELQQHESVGKKQISFSDQKRVFHYPKEDTFEEEEEEREDETEEEDEGTEVEEEEADDDPLTEAESLHFSCGGSANPEETEERLLTLAAEEGGGHLQADGPKNIGQSGLRMRNRKQT